MQEPVKIGFPVNNATVDVVGRVRPGSRVATVDVLLAADAAPALPLVAAAFEAELLDAAELAPAIAAMTAEV